MYTNVYIKTRYKEINIKQLTSLINIQIMNHITQILVIFLAAVLFADMSKIFLRKNMYQKSCGLCITNKIYQ